MLKRKSVCVLSWTCVQPCEFYYRGAWKSLLYTWPSMYKKRYIFIYVYMMAAYRQLLAKYCAVKGKLTMNMIVMLWALIVCSKKYFLNFIFGAIEAYENILTTKLSQFTVWSAGYLLEYHHFQWSKSSQQVYEWNLSTLFGCLKMLAICSVKHGQGSA